MDIFIAHPKEQSPLRKYLSEAVWEAWKDLQPTADPNNYVCSFPERWWWSERRCHGPIYCLADDDCLPEPTLDLNRIEELFRINPAYGIIALADVHGNHKRDWIVESTCVGGIRFIRKGCVTEFPENFSGDDAEYYELMTKAGYKSGICTEFTRLHLGEYHSLWQKERDKCPK